MVKARYKVDLSRQLAECEANYLRLCKLMPEDAEGAEGEGAEHWQFAISGGGPLSQTRSHTRIKVLERSRYTSTIQIKQTGDDDQPDVWLRAPQLTVRLYHDARLAEVLAWERHRRLHPRYDYPNQAMYQQDEKAQLNRFLGEWLGLCLEQGRSLETVW